jgi:hypothetical protein
MACSARIAIQITCVSGKGGARSGGNRRAACGGERLRAPPQQAPEAVGGLLVAASSRGRPRRLPGAPLYPSLGVIHMAPSCYGAPKKPAEATIRRRCVRRTAPAAGAVHAAERLPARRLAPLRCWIDSILNCC